MPRHSADCDRTIIGILSIQSNTKKLKDDHKVDLPGILMSPKYKTQVVGLSDRTLAQIPMFVG